MSKLILWIILFISTLNYSQVEQTDYNLFQAKGWSKDIALFRSKQFLFQEVLGTSNDVRKFSVIPLAASKSGELTTLIYKSKAPNKEGIVLGFFGDYWNDNGVLYQGYGFKNLGKSKTIAFFTKIEKAIEDNEKFLRKNQDNNNIYFEFDNLRVLIYMDGGFKIRLFWKNFDSTWEKTAFERSKRRFLRRIK